MRKLSFITIFALLTTSSLAMAVIVGSFGSWDDLTKNSPDIVIARCLQTPDPKIIIDGIILSDIEVLSILKGDTKPGTARMASGYWPHQGEHLLIFSFYQRNHYISIENFRVVSLGRYFFMDKLTGKSLQEQIRLVLRSRLEALGRKLQEGAEEKERLERGIE